MHAFAKAMLVAVPCGAAFAAAGAPLPWTLGPLVGCAVAGLAGVGLAVPRPARDAGQWVLGTVLGLYFTPTAFGELLRDAPLIAAGIAWVLLLGLGHAWLLRRLAGVSRPTAFFGGSIGGASESAIQGERHGGRVDQIAAAHSLRLVIVVLTIPTAFRLLGLQGTDPFEAGARTVDAGGLAMLVAATVAGGLALRALDWPNAWMMGPLAIAMGLTATGVQWSALPPAVVVAGQVLIGASLGTRFGPGFFARAPRLLAVTGAATVLGMALSAGFAGVLAAVSGLPWPTLVLATSPGGIAEMTLTAKTLQLGVPVVTAFHVVRSVVMLSALATVYRLLGRLRGWERDERDRRGATDAR